ncbi:MAG: hypothetical protein ABIZ80_00265, partial [Bryobacteraceae bacterium]
MRGLDLWRRAETVLPLADVRFFGRSGEEIGFAAMPAQRFAMMGQVSCIKNAQLIKSTSVPIGAWHIEPIAAQDEPERQRARDAGLPPAVVAGFEGTPVSPCRHPGRSRGIRRPPH